MNAIYLVNGSPHRLCDCSPYKGDCPKGVKRTLATSDLSRCLIPAPDVMMALTPQSESERTAWKPGDTRVVCAALMDASGRVVTGPRHFDGTMMEQIKRGPDVDAWRGAEQGFVDQKGHFLTREQAHEIAARQGQIIRRVGSDEMSLFSENLY